MENKTSDFKEMQEIIKGISAESAPLSHDEQLKRLKKNEAAISVKTINYYIKDMEKSKQIYSALRKILPEIIIHPENEKPVHFKTKNFHDQCSFLSTPVKQIHPAQFLFNIKAKNKSQVKELMEDITDLWHATDCDRELYELFGFSFEDYKTWLTYS